MQAIKFLHSRLNCLFLTLQKPNLFCTELMSKIIIVVCLPSSCCLEVFLQLQGMKLQKMKIEVEMKLPMLLVQSEE